MPLIPTPDGRYLFAIETAGEGDSNSVVYDRGVPVWDRFGYEARLGEHRQPRDPPSAVLPGEPEGSPSVPSPAVGGGRLIRITDERDGQLVHRMNSYYSSAYVHDSVAYVFVGHADNRPRFYEVNLQTGGVARLDSLMPYAGTADGWYFDKVGSIYLCDGPRLRRVNPLNIWEDNIAVDISDAHPGCDLSQAHSSDDGQTHSATVRRIVSDGQYPHIGTLVHRHGRSEFFPAIGALDESAVDPSGAFVVIKETIDGLLTNRIIELATRITRTLTNAQGAVGHSDLGPGILVGEWSPQHGEADGQCVLYNLREPLVPERRMTLFKTWNLGHLSYAAGRCLLSTETHLGLVGLDGSGVTLLLEHGMTGGANDYDTQVQGNLDRSGRVACFMSNRAGRLDAYLLVLS